MSQATQTTPIEAPAEEPAVPVSRPRFMFAFVVLYMLFLLDFSARLGVTSVFPAMQKALGLTDSQIGVAGSAVLDGDGAGITWDATGAVSKSPKGMVIQNGAYAGMD
mgnify:CR=1 FL=1